MSVLESYVAGLLYMAIGAAAFLAIRAYAIHANAKHGVTIRCAMPARAEWRAGASRIACSDAVIRAFEAACGAYESGCAIKGLPIPLTYISSALATRSGAPRACAPAALEEQMLSAASTLKDERICCGMLVRSDAACEGVAASAVYEAILYEGAYALPYRMSVRGLLRHNHVVCHTDLCAKHIGALRSGTISLFVPKARRGYIWNLMTSFGEHNGVMLFAYISGRLKVLTR